MAKPLRAAFQTLGCKTNHYESDAVALQFERAGFSRVPFHEAADIYLVNTCTVTAEADRKSRQMLRRARQLNPQALVVAMGCQAVLGDASRWADLVIDNNSKSMTLHHVCEALAQRGVLTASLPEMKVQEQEREQTQDQELGQDKEQAQAMDHTGTAPVLAGPRSENGAAFDDFGIVDRQSETRAYVKIEDGCNQFCAYCAIPLARGRVRSRPQQSVVAEVQALVTAGFREIVLTGIHLCSYGTDLGLPGETVMQLALELAAIEGLDRIRLGSLDPAAISPVFIDLAQQNPKLCPHFHLSLQSGCDRTLERMKRRYRTWDYRSVVMALREAFHDPGLTTDIMVGFPGESADDFAASLAFCGEMAFSRMHVFRFSARPGTAAARLPERVAPAELVSRSEIMSDLAATLARQFHERRVGQTLDVLLEQRLPDGCYTGYSADYVPVRLKTMQELEPGSLVQVCGIGADAEYLTAIPTDP